MYMQYHKMPTLDGNDIETKREEILNYFQNCFRRYESLFELLGDEKAYYEKANPLRHPLIFYFGHTAVFFINKLKIAKIIDNRIDSYLESIFAIGVDEMSWDDLNGTNYNWPSISNTLAYRQKVFDLVSELITTMPLTLPITWDSPWWIIMMGIEHENIHLETSSVLIRQLPIEYIKASHAFQPFLECGDHPQNIFIQVPQGKIFIGKSHQHDLYYGWDNEYGIHEADIPAFKASKFLVSNGEFLELVNDDGYKKDIYWDEEALDWRNYTNASYPAFWVKTDNGYKLRTVAHEIPLPLNWPVEVNYLEANAFCKWLSEKSLQPISLPTEDEYYRMLEISKKTNDMNVANIALRGSFSSSPVDKYKHGEFYDLVGNVWQWTKTPIYPFDTFRVHPIYDDFTVPTFDGKHNLIKGGSWISCGNLALPNSRYAFRRHFYQHAGFRYVVSGYSEHIQFGTYTKDKVVSEYCHFEWGENVLHVPNFPKNCIDIAANYLKDRKTSRALDLGCAIGRSSFELAKIFDEVIGIDFSARFIQYAIELKNGGELHYSMPTEGELESLHEIRLSDFKLDKYAHKVTFWQGDACNLKSIYKNFDLIFAGNLIDRLYDPKRFLVSLSERINKGGILVLTSPYTWLEEHTPKDKWLGGFIKNGKAVKTLESIGEILGDKFKLLAIHDVPFVIQETSRKHQHTISQMSVWERV